MAKSNAAAETAAPSDQDADHLTIEEFCARLSIADKRVELIGGFHATEVRAGRVKDSEAAFQGRFEKFANQPA